MNNVYKGVEDSRTLKGWGNPQVLLRKKLRGERPQGPITLDRTSGYDIEAVVTYDMEPFNDNDVLPPAGIYQTFLHRRRAVPLGVQPRD